MMNIQSAVCQMRIARHLGKISNTVQTRIMRRLGVNRFAHWETMMRLRASIERYCQPTLQAKRQAERDCYQVKFAVETESRKAAKVIAATPRKVKREILSGYEYTPEWWKDAEKRERAAKKAGLLVEA